MVFLKEKLSKRLAYSNELSETYTIKLLNKEKRNTYCFLSCLVLCIFVFFYLSRYNYGTLTISDISLRTESFFINNTDRCDKVSNEEKFDCFPRGIADSISCLARNCCWSPVNDLKVPWCYYSPSYESYKLINITKYKSNDVLLYDLVYNSSYPDNIQHIKMNVYYRNLYSLRIKISDAQNARFEPPYPEVPILGKRTFGENDYNILFDAKNVGFTIVRSSTQETLFDTKNVGGFTFADQFLQLSAKLPTKYIYGLGERRNNFLLDTNWTQITLFNHGNPPQDGINLYGSHPFFLGFDKSGLCFGVFLLNSNAMDIILQPTPAITYRAIGGIFDFFFFLGPSPADVVRQYLEVIGNPFLPPYWSLGFHLSRFGLLSLNDTINLWNKTRAATIPFDTQWNDIDYMVGRNDFTVNDNFKQLPDFVAQLHEVGMHYVVILDPGIASREESGTYPPYDIGLKNKIFVKDSTGKRPLEGKVWNKKGGTVFVDFTDPKSVNYWIQQINNLYKNISMDGLWVDMNEIENFVDGSQTGCGDNKWEHPPYVPAVNGGVLNYRTLCMSAQQYAGVHYNVHNLYGFSEAIVTSFAMAEIRGKRPFVLSRSTFSGFGHYAAHWTGDVFSTWDDLRHSVFDIMSFNLFGIPMVGADICGFNGNTTVELCQRWSQLGAFYPFSRNHNSDDCIDQDPVSLGPSVVESTRVALLNRYRLLPYLYTLFFKAHNDGETVVRPLFFEFPYDKNTYTINEQFLWGPALLITPVLYEGHISVDVYFPNTTWFDFYSGKAIHGEGKIVNIPAPLNTIPLFVRSGFIIPFQEPGITTKDSREGGFGILIAYNNSSQASGLLYWDDGESHNTYDDLKYNLLSFEASNEQFTSTVVNLGYNTTMRLQSVSVFGIGQVSSVSINGVVHGSFIYDRSVEVLEIFDVHVDLTDNIFIIWI